MTEFGGQLHISRLLADPGLGGTPRLAAINVENIGLVRPAQGVGVPEAVILSLVADDLDHALVRRAVAIPMKRVIDTAAGTLLLTGDFLLYESPVLAFLQICLRLAIPTAAFAVALLSLIRRRHSFFFESLCLLIAVIAIAPFLSNHFGLYFILLAALFAAVNYKKQ